MSTDSYKTITNITEGELKDRGSKFIGYAIPVFTTDEVKLHLKDLKSTHPNGRHVCYAYIIGEKSEEYRANDDGEPSGSAGLPILNQIKSFELTNTLVAVVRYFGGTKLGVSGLISAYKGAANLALIDATVISKKPCTLISAAFPHSSIGDVERLVRSNNLTVVSKEFAAACTWTFEVVKSDREQIETALKRISNVQICNED